MNKVQLGIIGVLVVIGVACVPLLLPRSSFVGTALPDPIILSVILALAGFIVLLFASMWKLKPWK